MRTRHETAVSPSKRFLRVVKQLCRSAGRDFRLYQAYAAWEGLNALAGSSVVLNLPQGTGKSFVSQLIANVHLQKEANEKVLVVVPTRELREQYVEMAAWMGESLTPRLSVVSFDDHIADLRKTAAMMVQVANIVVTTPQMFANRLAWFSEDTLKAITLCVLDEIDLWPIEDFHEPEGVRFHGSFAKLSSHLKKQRTRFLGLTASPLTQLGRRLLVGDLGCREVRPFHSSVASHLPKVRIEPVPCFDARVIARDAEISDLSRKIVSRLRQELGDGVLDAYHDDFWAYIKSLIGGREGSLVASLAAALLDKQRERNQLFEDVLPRPQVKVAHAKRIALSTLPSVIFCREIRLVKQFANERWFSKPAIAHSEMGDQYFVEIAKFKRAKCSVLLMTRDLGKRGLDFPMARSLVLCSPKSSWRTMDQELCRTRSNQAKEKKVYVLFYERTYEEEKLRRVLANLVQIRMHERFAKFTLSRPWTRWLTARDALTPLEFLSRTQPTDSKSDRREGRSQRPHIRRVSR